MTTYRCTTCGRRKQATDFARSVLRKPSKICRACKTVYNRDWYQRNKAAHVRNVSKNNARYKAEVQKRLTELKSQPCADCGGTFPPVAMDFDHVRGVKLGDISSLRLFPLKRVLEEVAKCEVVCAVCHRLRTAKRLEASGKKVYWAP